MFSRILGRSVRRCVTQTTPFLQSLTTSQFSRSISTVGVIGAGQMGTGIAYVSAVNAGKRVIVTDNSAEQLATSRDFIHNLLARNVSKERMTELEAKDALDRVEFVPNTDIAALRNVDFAIEAVVEDVKVKGALFEEMSKTIQPDALLASNTSSISITRIAAAAGERAHQVIGMHFFSPVPVMKICELIVGIQTSDDTLKVTEGLAEEMGKVTTRSDNTPGFIANRILMPYINEAVLTLEQGVATREDIDTTMKLGTAVPMGPLTLADFIGLDTCLSIMKVLHEGFGDSKYRPAPLLQQYVDAGWLGRKSGRGFYEYK